MTTFDFIFCCYLGLRILKKTDNLSKTLQRKDISAAEGQHLFWKNLETAKCTNCFGNVSWNGNLNLAWLIQNFHEKEKIPEHFQKTSNLQDTYHFHDAPKARYRQI